MQERIMRGCSKDEPSVTLVTPISGIRAQVKDEYNQTKPSIIQTVVKSKKKIKKKDSIFKPTPEKFLKGMYNN
jgi:hypothetical protein